MVGRSSTFPQTYAALPVEDLLFAYRSAPTRLRAALTLLDGDHLRARPLPDKWSCVEIAMHITDSEVVGAMRIRMAFAQPGSPLPGYDQDLWTAAWRHRRASRRELEASLTVFEALRSLLSPAWAHLPARAWTECWGTHPQHGAVTMRNLLELYADHAERHLAQILERRTLLGCAASTVPVLLPTRLY